MRDKKKGNKMLIQRNRNPYAGWKKEIIELMELHDKKEIRKINRAYRDIVMGYRSHIKKIKCNPSGIYVGEFTRMSEIEKAGCQEKPVFLVMSFTERSSLACAIVTYTKTKFSHITIALEPSLQNMYSFAVIQGTSIGNAKGGFCYESLNDYARSGAVIQVNCVWVSDEQYRITMEIISEMAKKRKETNYNLKGLIRFVLEQECPTDPKEMFCSEFAQYILKQAGVELLDKEPGTCLPQDFADIILPGRVCKVYEGPAEYYRGTGMIIC